MIVNKDWEDVLPDYTGPIHCLFADPPDNLGLDYNGYVDKVDADEYYSKFYSLLLNAVTKSPISWISYYHTHDVEVKSMCKKLGMSVKTFIWRFTFGQYRSHDFASGYRPIIRILRDDAILYPDAVLEPSVRELIGDLRAKKGGRVPDDVWEFPRVVGNAKERRTWHPTQHPEALIERILKFSTKEGDTIFDCYAGTGTVERVAKRLNRKSVSCEIDPFYCEKICQEQATT